MSEGIYGQQQVLACGCVGACTCFGEPTKSGQLWATQDATGNQYLWTGREWVNLLSAEGQSIAADPSNYAAEVIFVSGDYWYAQGDNGQLYVWTANGWVPPATGYADPAATPAYGAVGPPAVGPVIGATEDPNVASILASGDPAAIQHLTNQTTINGQMSRDWLTMDNRIDTDNDRVANPFDHEPGDADVQRIGDIDTNEPPPGPY